MHTRRTFLKVTAAAASAYAVLPTFARSKRGKEYDVVIYGGSSAGVIAAVQAKRMGKSVAIVNPYSFLGGMTASGLGAVDMRTTVSGMTRDFFSRYGVSSENQLSLARIESHVAELAFNRLVAEADIPVFDSERLNLTDGVLLSGSRIASIRTDLDRVFSARVFIDASYEGDLMAKAGVRYSVGRESNAQHGETINGFQRVVANDISRLSDNGFVDRVTKKVDPYVIRGQPSSGLLPRVNQVQSKNGTADSRIQAYNYRLVLTNDPTNRIPFDKPEGYREIEHELLLRNFEAGDERLPGRMVEMPNRKFDWNSSGAVGTNLAGANWDYPNATHQRRAEIDWEHECYVRGHLWTLAHHPRVPDSIRRTMQGFGFAKDEFVRNNGFPYMLYQREGRRMIGEVVMTERHCRGQSVVADPISLASYPMDSHIVQFIVNERGHLEEEGILFKACCGPYGVSYRSIVPIRQECSNLLVPICLSATHVAYGSIRMEPDFMSLAQAAATAASIAIDKGIPVQMVPYADLRERLLADHVVLDS